MSRIKIGLQLYTLRELTEKDFSARWKRWPKWAMRRLNLLGTGALKPKK